mgnify:CR=1 FL=1
MLQRYIVSYDISNQKRWRKVFKAMRGFGDHIQYSVFSCELSDKDRVRMIEALGKVINHREDQVLIVDLGPAEGRAADCIEAVGRAYTHPERHAIVV